MLQTLARRVLPASLRSRLRRWTRAGGPVPASANYEIINAATVADSPPGWCDPEVAKRQQQAFEPLLEQMRAGAPRQDFIALTEAVAATQTCNPLVIEVGCGSGWNSEVLARLWHQPFRYVGSDCSPAMTTLGRKTYPAVHFVTGDAVRLPFRDAACDILVSGTVLMHLLDWASAIRESQRVARAWCVFHTLPTVERRPTILLRKQAYGSPVVEIVFNSRELLARFEENGLRVRKIIPSVPHEYLGALLGEPVQTLTYLCEKSRP